VISVLIVDDSVVVRRLVADALGADPAIHVAGTAANGQIALTKIEQLSPDLVTLDIEMPVMDGLATLREIRKRHPRLPVIMFSTLTAFGASATLDALSAGASDYVTKPANVGSVRESIEAVRSQLVPRIHALVAPARRTTPPAAAVPASPAVIPSAVARPPVAPPAAAPHAGPPAARIDVLAVGCSTGGPAALAEVLAALPANLPVPVVVVQHMPPVFTTLLADRLNRTTAVTVVEAADGTLLRPGTVYIAPGDRHLEVAKDTAGRPVTRLTQAPPENYCRPAVDVLFRSVAAHYGAAAFGVVMTGMGSDGKIGAAALRAAGSRILAQDEASSVVWGMPGAVVSAGLADSVLPLNQIGHRMAARAADGRPAMEGAVAR
jgi:two-component system chemotaxis response regulator CheB